MLRTISAFLLMLSTVLGQQWYPFSEPNEAYWPTPPGYSIPTIYFSYQASNNDINGVYTPTQYWVRVYVTFRDRYIPGIGHEGGGGGEFWVFLDPSNDSDFIPITSSLMLMSDNAIDLEIFNSQRFDPVVPLVGPLSILYPWTPQPIHTGFIIHRTPQLGGTAFGVEINYWLRMQVLIGIMEVPSAVISDGFDIHIIANLDTVLDGSGWVYKRLSYIRRY